MMLIVVLVVLALFIAYRSRDLTTYLPFVQPASSASQAEPPTTEVDMLDVFFQSPKFLVDRVETIIEGKRVVARFLQDISDITDEISIEELESGPEGPRQVDLMPRESGKKEYFIYLKGKVGKKGTVFFSISRTDQKTVDKSYTFKFKKKESPFYVMANKAGQGEVLIKHRGKTILHIGGQR